MVSIDRHVGQRVFVGEDCVVTVLAIEGNSVRLNFVAPKNVKIAREELNKRPADRSTPAKSVP